MIVANIHATSMARASALTSFQVMDPIAPLDVITILNRNEIRFILVGAYGLVGWTKKPRATEDVDVVVAARQHKKAVRVLAEHFPHLQADEQEVVTRMRDRETRSVAIDVIRPQALYREAFKHVAWVEEGKVRYRIPSLEMALAMKFAPMISLTREDAKKYMDAHDFILIVQANPEIDLDQLAVLGEIVYPGGGKEIVEKVEAVRAGKKLQL